MVPLLVCFMLSAMLLLASVYLAGATLTAVYIRRTDKQAWPVGRSLSWPLYWTGLFIFSLLVTFVAWRLKSQGTPVI